MMKLVGDPPSHRILGIFQYGMLKALRLGGGGFDPADFKT